MKKNPLANVRRGQVITTFGPGALINLEIGSFIGMGIDSWPNNLRQDAIYEERLQNRLRVSYFRQPSSVESFAKGVPYRRFPRWLFCRKCRLLKVYEDWVVNDTRKYPTTPRCNTCNKGLVPMSFLVVCRKGHLDDFPWVNWVHRNRGACNPNPVLKYDTNLAGVGLSGLTIKCMGCSAKRFMQGAFSPKAFEHSCTGRMPWSKDNGCEPCTEHPVAVQRGGSNVYFPRIVSSITIPPYTDTLFERIRQTNLWAALDTTDGMIDEATRDKLLDKIASEINSTLAEVKKCIGNMKKLSEAAGAQSDEDYRFDEYQAFHGRFDAATNNKRDFEVVPGNEGFDYSPYGIKDIFLVKSLREVRALIGFTRLSPLEPDMEFAGSEEENLKPSELVKLSDRPGHEATWKPAIEVRGEGIFITLDPKRLDTWSQNPKVAERQQQINKNYQDSCTRRRIKKFKPITAKYVLLHSLAHLLIRQLSFESGYSGASLRERIYCNSEGKKRMEGILIYTAAGDADGTLGGLVRQAKPERFSAVLNSMIENARWCANDPLCIESSGQGFESLNMAACYACGLLPETSCEEFNKFLDRALITGSPDAPEIGFLSR